MSRVSGWRTAARIIGDSVSPMMIRRMVARGELRATKNAEGAYEFESDDLDALKLKLASTDRPIAPAIAAPHPETISGAAGGEREPIAAAAPTSAIAPWLLAAAARRDGEREDDGGQVDDAYEVVDRDEAGRGTAEPNRWLASQPPLGSSRSSSPTSGFPFAGFGVQAAAASHVQRIAELEQRVVELRRDLTARQAEVAAWRSAWRAERVSAIVANERAACSAAGHTPDLAHAVGAAVYQAVAAIVDDGQLADDRVVAVAARTAGTTVVGWAAMHVQAWAQAERQEHNARNDVARARARRRTLRRW